MMKLGRVVCGMIMGAASLLADATAQESPPETILYREVVVPADDLDRVVQDCLPQTRAEFEELVRGADLSFAASSTATFAAASFRAELRDDSLVNGTATLRELRFMNSVARRPGAMDRPGVSAQAPLVEDVFLPLDVNTSVERPRWRVGDALHPAVWGSVGRHSLLLVHPTADALEFNWSLRGRRRDGSIVFRLTTPPALSHRIQLTTARRLIVHADHGAVSRRADPDDALSDWTVEWGGEPEVTITIRQPSPAEGDDGNPQLVQTSRYRLEDRGLELQDTFELSPAANSASTLLLAVDAPLNVTSVASNGRQLGWSRVPGTDGRQILIDVPPWPEDPIATAPAGRSSATIQVRAVGDFPWQQRFTLPRLRADQVRWQAETLFLDVRSPLRVTDLRTQGCRCSRIDDVAGASGDETLQVVVESPSSAIDIQVQQRAAEPQAEIGYFLELAAGSIQCAADARLWPAFGEAFDFSFQIAPEWLIDSVDVEAENPGTGEPILDAWEYQGDRLDVRLVRAATKENPVRLRVGLHRAARLADDLISVAELAPLRTIDRASNSQWLAARGAAPFRLRIENVARGAWLNPADLPAWLGRRWLPGENECLLALDQESRDVLIGVRAAPAPLQASSQTDVRLRPHSLSESVDMSIDPQGSQLGRFVVKFSRPVPADAKWLLDGAAEGLVVTPADSTEDGSTRTLQFFVSLTPARDAPFQLHTHFQLDGGRRRDVPLATVVDATNDTGTVGVHVEGGADVQIVEGDGLQPMPIRAFAANGREQKDLRAAFRYDAAAGTIPPELTLRTQVDSSHPLCWAWRCELRSYYPRQGPPRHRADFFVQNEGASSFVVQIPAGHRWEKIEVDGAAIDGVDVGVAADNWLSIPLPVERAYPCVTIRYQDSRRQLHALDWLEPPLVESQSPVLQRVWQLWLPRTFRVDVHSTRQESDDWLTRLFGPLARSTTNGRRFSWTDAWQRWMFSTQPDQRIVVQQFATLLGRSELAIKGTSGEATDARENEATSELTRTPTWGERLTDIESTIARTRPRFRMFLDAVELRRLGVFFDTPLPASGRAAPRQIGMDRLEQAGLGLLVGEDRLVVTSAAEIIESVPDGDEMDAVAAALVDDSVPLTRLESPTLWRDGFTRELWRPTVDPLENDLNQAGWVPHRLTPVSAEDSIAVYQRDAAASAGSILFLACSGLGWWLGRRKWRIGAAVFASTLILAMVLPSPAAGLARTAFWASLAGWVLASTARAGGQRNRPASPLPQPLATTIAAVRWVFLLALLALGCSWVEAQEVARPPRANGQESQADPQPDAGIPVEFTAEPLPTPESTPDVQNAATDQVYSVFSPATDDPTGTGNIVYLPVPLYRLLHQVRSSSSSAGYLFTRASYTGAWPRGGDATPLRITASYRISTFASRVEVPLPAFDAGVKLDLSSLRVDRQPIALTAGSQGRPRITLLDPDDYSISFDLLPSVQKHQGHESIRFSIPSLSQSQLELSLPRDVQSAGVPSAVGDTVLDPQRGTLRSHLGPCSELVARVTRGGTKEAEQDGVDQLTWLKWTDEGARLSAHFRFAGRSAPLRLRVDPALQLIAPDDSTSTAILSWDPREGELVIGGDDAAAVLTAEFRIDNRVAVGRFDLPYPRVIDLPLRRQWIAVSAPSAWSVTVEPDLSQVSLPQFLDAWPELPSAPGEILAAENAAPLTIVARQTRSRAQWTSNTSFFFGAGDAQFLVNAELAAHDAATLRLRVPASMDLRQVTAAGNGSAARVRWNVDASGELLLFFLDRPTGLVQIALSGRLTLPPAGESAKVSSVEPIDAERDVEIFRIYRSSRTSVQVLRADGLLQSPAEEDRPAALEDQPTRNRLVGSWRSIALADEETPSLTVRVSASQPQVGGRMVTTLHRDETGWYAHVQVRLDAANEPIDVLRFDIPADISLASFPEHVRPEQQPGPSANRRILAVWLPPNQAPDELLDLRFRISVPEQEGVSLPRIELLEVDPLVQDVVLPTRGFVVGDASTEESAYAWSPEGLRPLAAADADAAPGYDAYRVEQKDYRAKLRKVAVDRQPRIHLLHTSVAWDAAGDFVALATFDLQPGSLLTCTLQFPRGAEVVQVLVDNNRAAARKAAQDDQPSAPQGAAWQVQLGASPWPLRLQVLYRGPALLGDHGRLAFEAPRLDAGDGRPIPISRTTWSVSGPREAGLAMVADVNLEQGPRDADLAALRSLGALLEDAQLLVRDSPREDIVAWFLPWGRRSRAVLNRLRGTDGADGTDDNPAQQEVNQLVADYRIRLDSLALSETWEDLLIRGDELDQQDLWHEGRWRNGSLIRCQTASPVGSTLPSLIVHYPRFGGPRRHVRYLLAAIVAVAAVAWPRRLNAARLAPWVQRFPYLIGLGVGLVWWAFLTPAWCGLLVFLAALSAWSYGWLRQRRLSREDLFPAATGRDGRPRESW